MLHAKCEDFSSAYRVTQFFEGELFYFVNFLLRKNYTPEEDILSSHLFIKSFMRFTAQFLKWISQEPQTVS